MSDTPTFNYHDGRITVAITSYNRWEMLQQTLDSFMSVNNHPVERFVVIEDSMNKEIAHNIINKYGDKVDLIFNAKRIGQAPSLDRIYRTVYTQYIFHSEDDYLYDGNPSWLRESKEILDERSDVHQVWCRYWDDYADNGGYEQFEDDILKTSTGVSYKMLAVGDWKGFSWNCGLRRTEDYLKMFPEGFGKFTGPESFLSGVQTEFRCNENAGKFGYRGALLLAGGAWNKGKNNRDIATYK